MDTLFQIYATREADVPAILEITRGTGVFDAQEADTVSELLGEYFSKGAAESGYTFFSCRAEGQLVGFACCGPRPLTAGTFDLYWIATAPQTQGHGAGGQLLRRCIEEVKAQGGYLLVAETSGREDYQAARSFYEHHHFEKAAHIADFYAPGDDLVMYILRF